MSVLVGVLPSQLPLSDKTISPLFARKYSFPKEDLHNLPADVIRKRPDVATVEQQLIGKNAQVGKAVAELYPAVNLSALWGYASQGGRHLFGSKSQMFQYNFLVQLPLLDWKRLQNNVRLQKYIREEYVQQYKSAVLNAVAELKIAAFEYQRNLQANARQRQALNASRHVVEASLKKYDSGLSEFSELLTNQQNYI